MNIGCGILCYYHIVVCTCVRTCVCFVTKCHVTCHNYQVFHVRTYFLCLRTKCQEACNNYQVFHVHIFYLLISEVYQHLCELVEWHHLHSLQPLKSASESEKFCGSETNCSFSRMSSYAILLFCLLDKDYSMLHDYSSWLGYSALFMERLSLSAP